MPFAKEGEELRFQILAEPHEPGSVIITNLGFAKVFGDYRWSIFGCYFQEDWATDW